MVQESLASRDITRDRPGQDFGTSPPGRPHFPGGKKDGPPPHLFYPIAAMAYLGPWCDLWMQALTD